MSTANISIESDHDSIDHTYACIYLAQTLDFLLSKLNNEHVQ